MAPRLQNLWFVVSLVIAVYVLGVGVPMQIQANYIPTDFSKKTSQVEKQTLPPHSSVAPGFIQVKASGEEAVPGSLSDNNLEEQWNAREDFEKRFGEALEHDKRAFPTLHYSFPIPPGLKDTVDFWIAVFGRYGKDQYIFSDKDDVSIIYGVLDLSRMTPAQYGLSKEGLASFKRKVLEEEKSQIRKMLQTLLQKLQSGMPLTAEEERLNRLFKNSASATLEKAAGISQIRIQEGYSHRFKQSIVLSGQYMDEMERIFAAKGLPVELTRLPFVESAFNIRALSSAGARGLWQFIEPTGKLYLKVDSIADERLDPILSTYAAADHLKNDYDLLGSWPLAVNSFNTGPGRMLKAKDQLKTDDITTIIRNFVNPGYQFFSRNYYPEFLAALTVYENQNHYFGPIQKMAPLRSDYFFPGRKVNLSELAAQMNVPQETMKKLNPCLSTDVLEGRNVLPVGYLVKVPYGLGKNFELAMRDMHHENEDPDLPVLMDGLALANPADTPKAAVASPPIDPVDTEQPDLSPNTDTVGTDDVPNNDVPGMEEGVPQPEK